jgi:hypothetical protein
VGDIRKVLALQKMMVDGAVPADLAACVDRVRALTAPLAEDEQVPRPNIRAVQCLIHAIAQLIDLGWELAAKEGL